MENQDTAMQQFNSPQTMKQLPEEFATPGSSSL